MLTCQQNEVAVMTALSTLPNKDYAVLLNANAGRVNARLEKRLKPLVPEGRFFMTQSQLHARDVLQSCLDDNVSAIFAGGGDGTIVDVINSLYELESGQALPKGCASLRHRKRPCGLAWLKQSPKGFRLMESPTRHQLQQMHLVEAEDTLFPFAGLGIDAAILNDYYQVKITEKANGTKT